ncbi:MAG: tol-pal system YbgF family protein [Phycisphaeraceae bacterium]
MADRIGLSSFVAGVLLLAVLCPFGATADEVLYPSDDFAKLDTFESIAVEDADKLFIKKDYPGAYAAYKAYSIEFAQGEALPYVLLRMGRCLHLAGKRNTAVKAYQDVVDYFPNDVRYAAAALYYIGQCHQQNGNEDKALAVWAKMVKDKAYVAQSNSGAALIKLAEAMQKRGDYNEAVEYQWRTAVAFRKSNRKVAETARKSVEFHYIVRNPNQEKLLAFCNEVGGFGWRQNIDQPEENATYWRHVLNLVLSTKLEAEKRADVALYWDGQMGDRFAENDALRVSWFKTRLAHDKALEAWANRMDTQFNLKPVTIARVKGWLGYYNAYPKLRSAFFKTHGEPLLTGLNTEEKIKLLEHLRHPLRMHDEAMQVLKTVRTTGMADPALAKFANYVAEYEGEDAFLLTVNKIKDKTFATRVRFDYYYARSHRNGENQKKALAEVPVLSKSPDHAQAIVWPHATLMQWQGEYDQAIKLYRAANRQPQSTWAVIDCYIAMKQHGKAIELCNELQVLGGDTAAQACLKAADIYRIAGDKGKEVQQLQLTLRRYPGTRQSSESHQRLEKYGVKIIGGEAEAKD